MGMSVNFLQVVDGNITVPGMDLEAEVGPGTVTGVFYVKHQGTY